MRDDLQHTLTDTNRRGGGKFREVRNSVENRRVDEDAPGGKVSIHWHRRNTMVGRKRFGENWAALVGLVDKSVGRRWDTFYSELCKAYDPTKQVNYHIFQHLFGFPVNIELNCRVKRIGKKDVVCVLEESMPIEVRKWDPATGKVIKIADKTYDDRWVPIWKTWTLYYVDPRDGIIKKNKWPAKRAAEKGRRDRNRLGKDGEHLRRISPTEELHFEDGIWYYYTLARRPKPIITFGVPGLTDEDFESRDPAFKKAHGRWFYREIEVTSQYTPKKPTKSLSSTYDPKIRRYVKSEWYYNSKKVASRNLLKKFGLRGTAEPKEGDGLSRRELAAYS